MPSRNANRAVAVRFAERRFGLEILGVDQPFDDDLGLGGDEEIDSARAHHVDRRAGEFARHRELVDTPSPTPLPTGG